jgi:hypothetical protein
MITPRVPYAEYKGIRSLNISSLKELKRSPLHYKYRLENFSEPTDAMLLGSATHVAVLEPARYELCYAVWDKRTESDRMAPRKGAAWDIFCARNADKEIITLDQHSEAIAMQEAIRGSAVAMKYLASGEPEIVIKTEMYGRLCKGRVDWLTTIDGQLTCVGLKTARDCRPFVFGKQSAVLGYHMQWAWYFDLIKFSTGTEPAMKELVVESAAPHAVAAYNITEDIIAQGREDFQVLLKILDECEASGKWPGPVAEEEDLTMPTWAYTQSPDDITDLGLEK